MKIDTEGAELDVIQGMTLLLAGKLGARPTLTLEVGDTGAVSATRPSRQVVEAMLVRGYRALEFQAGHWVSHRIRDRYAYTNLLFEPAGDRPAPQECPRSPH